MGWVNRLGPGCSLHDLAVPRFGAAVRRVASGGRRFDLPDHHNPVLGHGVSTLVTRVFAHETFGPVTSVYKVATDEDALTAANDSGYGLNASVWSRSGGREVANQIQAGTVNVNDGYGAAWASYGSPMGGMKLSGIGRRHGVPGLQKYTQAQTVAVQHVVPVSGPRWLSHKSWSRVLTVGAKVMRHLP